MEFASVLSYSNFAAVVRRERRHVLKDEQTLFVKALTSTAVTRKDIIPAGTCLWRAQIGCSWELDEGYPDDPIVVPAPYPKERMKPLAYGAHEGRINPKGIACLYLSDNRSTAVAEVRPLVGDHISLGLFEITKDIFLVDCTVKSRGLHCLVYSQDGHLIEPSAADREVRVWKDINRAFSTPLNVNDTVADYAPTQFIAEVFKAEGYDGLAYSSSLGEGVNIALFDLSVADITHCHVVEVDKVAYSVSSAGGYNY